MAFQINAKLDNGLSIEKSYARIETVGGGRKGASIEIWYYLSRSKSRGDYEPLKKEYYNFVPDITDEGKNFIKQGYDYLTDLPEFEYAIPILEGDQTV